MFDFQAIYFQTLSDDSYWATINTILKMRKMPVSEFASSINRTRTVVYNIFERQTIDTGLLLQISKVLNHDFFNYYTKEELFNESKISTDLEITKLKSLIIQKEMEIEYLKKINNLLESNKNMN